MILSGYFIVRNKNGYFGVDSEHYEPGVDLNENTMRTLNGNPNTIPLYEYYKDQKTREIFKYYEEGSVKNSFDVEILENIDTAKFIYSTMPNNKDYFLIKVSVFEVDDLYSTELYKVKDNFIGFDLAYLGGDYYSAIYNGLLHKNNSPLLFSKYSNLLNTFNLITSASILSEYLKDFKLQALSEANSIFYIYAIEMEA